MRKERAVARLVAAGVAARSRVQLRERVKIEKRQEAAE